MNKLISGVIGALIVAGAVFVACGGNNDNKIHFVDSNVDSSGAACNVIDQTGCQANEKCTWIADQAKPTRLGHIACAPNGDKTDGQACTRNAPGPMGWDDCVKGYFCRGTVDSADGGAGFCHQICDPSGLDALGACAPDHGCTQYSAIFQEGSAYVGGMCDQKCNPLTDNDFLRPVGSAAVRNPVCQDNEGCYGAPQSGSGKLPTEFTCARERNTDLWNRHLCGSADGNGGNGCRARNDCAQGYIPLLYQQTGSMNVICVKECEPANCYSGNCGGAANPNHLGTTTPQHGCRSQDGLGTYNDADPNGEHCVYNWRYEIDSMGGFLRSPWSDKVGWCQDHTQYRYDSNNDGMFKTDGTDDPFPACALMPNGFGTGSATGSNTPGACSYQNGCVAAATFGCVDTTNAGLPAFENNSERLREMNKRVNMPRPVGDDSAR